MRENATSQGDDDVAVSGFKTRTLMSDRTGMTGMCRGRKGQGSPGIAEEGGLKARILGLRDRWALLHSVEKGQAWRGVRLPSN